MHSKLKPLRNLGAFDGEKEKADIPRDMPIPKTCNHKNIKVISGNELRCKCGVGFTGPNIMALYRAIKQDSS